jgi:hypothetical protein
LARLSIIKLCVIVVDFIQHLAKIKIKTQF